MSHPNFQSDMRRRHYFTNLDRMTLSSVAMILSLGVLITVVRLASSVCDCGYSLQEFEGGGLVVFMDRLETNFSQLQSIAQSHNWVAQEFTVSAEDGRGNYSKAFESSNVVIRAAQPRDEPGRDPGVELHVSSVISKNNAIPASEIDTTRLDLHWGSFRAGMKLTDTGGTCAAFFWVSKLHWLSNRGGLTG